MVAVHCVLGHEREMGGAWGGCREIICRGAKSPMWSRHINTLKRKVAGGGQGSRTLLVQAAC